MKSLDDKWMEQKQILQVITLDFLIVPLVLIVGGILTLIVSIFGLVAVAREVIRTSCSS